MKCYEIKQINSALSLAESLFDLSLQLSVMPALERMRGACGGEAKSGHDSWEGYQTLEGGEIEKGRRGKKQEIRKKRKGIEKGKEMTGKAAVEVAHSLSRSSWNVLQTTAPDAPPFQLHTTQFHSSGANVSLSVSLRHPLLSASHLCPRVYLHLHSFISSLTFSSLSLTSSLPSFFNAPF